MTDWLLALVPTYGLWLIAGTTFASCLALPIPASVIMLAAGGFAAAGDLVLWQVVVSALSGALAGDQVGYGAGRMGGGPFLDRIAKAPSRAKVVTKARSTMEAKGGIAVFLSRWLFSPLGPYVNVISGAMRHNWLRFTLWAALGEVVWCSLYVLMGRGFAGNLSAASDMLGSILGLVASGTAVLGLGWWLLLLARKEHAQRKARRGLSEAQD
ncbi:DedA family protein [Pseudotabrizicola sp. L79]|uniref:DedA family protein n=1 Tax=Pseudotabrizicola sp. L79 TaxID=3118402 RepID=UPI002F95CDB4